MNAVLIFLMCVVFGAFGLFVILDTEPSTEVGTTITLKPGVKINDTYCYNPNINRYEICL
ncbi:hypothetical protein HI145_RS00270 [Escherichia coli]|nr:hypothetical protein [Escherichia coli]